MISATVINDSQSEARIRLTSFEVEYPSAMLAEIVSNRELSVSTFGGNVTHAYPGEYRRSLITATDFESFFDKYAHNQHIAFSGAFTTLIQLMRRAADASTPAARPADAWHLPYIDLYTIEDAILHAFDDGPKSGLEPAQLDYAATYICQKVSALRCFAVAFPWPTEPEKKTRTVESEVKRYDALLTRGLLDTAALEHVAQADRLVNEIAGQSRWLSPTYHGNFTGWMQYRRGIVEAARPTMSAAVIPIDSFRKPLEEAQSHACGCHHTH